MRDSRSSLNNNCIFVLPVSDTVELLLSYRGEEWSNENINEDRLRSFSDNCEGFNITFFENANGKILLVSQKEQVEDSIEIYFERIDMESLPCAFFDKGTKTYDNFVIPASTTSMAINISEEGDFMIEWDFEDPEEDVEEDPVEYFDDENPEDVFDESVVTKPQNIIEVKQEPLDDGDALEEENKSLKKANEELSSANEDLHTEAESLRADVTRLEARIRELEMNPQSVQNSDDKDKEIIELNRLIRQLADDRFNDLYVKTQNVEIDSLTESISKQKKVLEEKARSKTKLEQDLAKIESETTEIRASITELMVNIDKAESIQKERSAELDEKQLRINALLADLGMDMDTLNMYSVDGSLETILSEAESLKNRLEEKLESLIQERQRECDERSNRLKGSS